MCKIFTVLATFALAGCGITYVDSNVSSMNSDVPVRVVALNPETVLLANRSAYTPRNLPNEFFAIATGRTLRGPEALPDAPFVPDPEAPRTLELRAPPPIPDGPYRIGVSDVLLIATNSGASTIEELSGLLAAQNRRQGYKVRDDGAISIPDVGRVMVAGMTIEAAEAAIFQLLVENGLNPAFSLEVTEFNSQRVVIGGAVRAPQVIPINSRPVTLDLAITAAGGLQIADESFASIRIFRDGTLYQIPVTDFLTRPDLQNTRLQNGDAIYVDVTYDLDRALQYFRTQLDVISLRAQSANDALSALSAEVGMRRAELQEVRSNFQSRLALDAEDRDYVYLTGEIATNGRLPLPFNRQATLADVLFESGGFPEETGSPAQIYVLRPSPHAEEFGAVTAWHLDARNPAAMTLATRMEMRPNDIVFLDAQVITTWNRALRQFFPVFINTALARGLN